MLTKARNSMTFGERLVYVRKKKGLNQQQLAKLIGVSSCLISYWKNGKYKPDISKIRKIVKALEISEDWLIGNDNFRMNQQDIKLTKEQQKLVAENEYIIKYVFNRLHTIQIMMTSMAMLQLAYVKLLGIMMKTKESHFPQ